MAYPVLAAQNTWWAPTVSSVTKAGITEIEIKDSYTPEGTVTDSWDASVAKDGSITCYVIGAKLIIAGNGSGKIAANEDSSKFFGTGSQDSFSNATQIIGFETLDTSMTINMSYFFYYLKSIQSLDLKSFNMENVTNVSYMFRNCSSLKYIDVSGWNIPKLTSMSDMFFRCDVLEEVVGFDDVDTSKVTDMSAMFYGSNISHIPEFDTSNVTTMYQMFFMYRGEEIILPAWNTSKVTDMRNMFSNLIPDYGGLDEEHDVLRLVDLSNIDTSSVTTMQNMFDYRKNLKTIVFGNFSTKSLTNVAAMFGDNKSLESIDFPKEATFEKVQNFASMFTGCSGLKNLDVSNWNTSSCTDMGFMFYECSSLKEIDVSNWDVSKVADFDHFAAHANLKRKGIENWKTTSATSMNALFHNCAEEELDLSGWDVSKVQFFCQMFENSTNLKRVKGLEKWNTSSGLGFDEMFARCSKLEEVDLSSFNTTKAKNNVSASYNGHKTATLKNMFQNCNNLKKVTVGPNFSINGNGSNTIAANKAILPTPSATYIAGADGNWYTFVGDSYAPNAMKDKTAETYYASPVMVYDADVIVKNGSLIDTAKAIREKNGATTHYTPAQFGAAIRTL